MPDLQFRADCFFLDPEHGEKSYDLYFTAPSVEEAARSAFMWADVRNQVLPEIFGTLCCVKIYPLDPRPIVNGSYQGATGFCVYEWKYDTGRPRPKLEEPTHASS